MARVGIILKKSSSSYTAGSPPPRVRFGRLKSAAIVLVVGLVLIGLLLAVFVVGSVLAAVILVLMVVSLIVLVLKLLFGLPRRRGPFC
jgi:cell division protein FtsW (lipid II flippase)